MIFLGFPEVKMHFCRYMQGKESRLPYWNKGRGWRRETGLSPPVKYFTECSKAVLLLWIFYVFSVLRLLCLCVRLFICALWSPAGKGLTSWLSFVVSYCEFVTFDRISWVRCGIDCFDSCSLHHYLLFNKFILN